LYDPARSAVTDTTRFGLLRSTTGCPHADRLDSANNRFGSPADRLDSPDDRFGSPADQLDWPDDRLASATIAGRARRAPHRGRSVTQSRGQKLAPAVPVENEARFNNLLEKERNYEKLLVNPAGR